MEKNKNNRYLVGIISGLRETAIKSGIKTTENQVRFYSSSDFSGFYNKEDERYTNKHVESLATFINSPWSQDDESYLIKVNCKDAYTEMNPEDPKWKCEYTIIGYDGITTIIFGYGNTEEEALADCKRLFKLLQKNYNKENVSI